MAYLTDRPRSQGELDFWLVTADHFDGLPMTSLCADGRHHILAHSESGNHHVIDRASVLEISKVSGEIFERLRMMVSEPTLVRNLSPGGHADLDLAPGLYDVIKRRELGLDDVMRSSAD